ncbi:hypothetical protein B9Z55_000637 [Caenorhabditis nigoni]|nr:hypothetical protein B9Z55_000637 [Caenorhabditis nigoni]
MAKMKFNRDQPIRWKALAALCALVFTGNTILWQNYHEKMISTPICVYFSFLFPALVLATQVFSTPTIYWIQEKDWNLPHQLIIKPIIFLITLKILHDIFPSPVDCPVSDTQKMCKEIYEILNFVRFAMEFLSFYHLQELCSIWRATQLEVVFRGEKISELSWVNGVWKEIKPKKRKF